MPDPLERLREEVADDLDRDEDGVPPDQDLEDLEQLLARYFAERPEGEVFLRALDILADGEAEHEIVRRPVRARQPRANPLTVEQVLGRSGAELRRTISTHLGLTEDGASLLADRPAAALSTHPAPRVAALADRCGASRGRLLRAIAASAREGGQYVYAFRPGAAHVTPATKEEEADDLLAWGRALLEAPRAEGRG